jgi:ribonuclease Z
MEIKVQELTIKPSSYDSITLYGQSLAGNRTCIAIPKLNLCFDIGFLSDIATNQEFVLISHGHADHIGCLHLHAFSRRMHCMATPTYYMPESSINDFNIAHDAYKRLNRHTDHHQFLTRQYNLNPIKYLEQYNLNNNMFFKAYPTVHGVDSQGYCIFKKISKLKDIYKGKSSKEIGQIRKDGNEVSEITELNLIAFSGDTTINGILQHDDIMKSKILILECTYINTDDKSDGKTKIDTKEEAEKRGHIHEQHIIDNKDKFQNEILILTHVSARYTADELKLCLERLKIMFPNKGINS